MRIFFSYGNNNFTLNRMTICFNRKIEETKPTLCENISSGVYCDTQVSISNIDLSKNEDKTINKNDI